MNSISVMFWRYITPDLGITIHLDIYFLLITECIEMGCIASSPLTNEMAVNKFEILIPT